MEVRAPELLQGKRTLEDGRCCAQKLDINMIVSQSTAKAAPMVADLPPDSPDQSPSTLVLHDMSCMFYGSDWKLSIELWCQCMVLKVRWLQATVHCAY